MNDTTKAFETPITPLIDQWARGVTIKELSALTRTPAKTIYDWIYRDILPPNCIIRWNGRLRLIRSAVEAWMAGQQDSQRVNSRHMQ